jgi:PPK2 family polyphosphate:nucleotide phosphotransferase
MKNLKAIKIQGQIKIKDLPTNIDHNHSKDYLEDALNDIREELADLQDRMYAHNKYSVLICLQGMDTAGKDSLIREVFKEFNARGVVVHSFKAPQATELEHDFLWRHYIALPERGKFGVFNRTYYENVLVTRVNPQFLLNENLPNIQKVEDVTDAFWANRFESINAFEKHLINNGTIVLKFYLHLSKEEQRQRLMRRLEKQKHQWKFSPGDIKERALWYKYQACYEEILNQSSTEIAPWYVVPADDKEACRLMVAQTILETLKQFTDIKEPELDPKVKADLDMYYQGLKNEQ